jgi:asparagine synthase (glutamine-hydrolysing)
MCGVAGVYAYSASGPAVDRDELRAVRDHMRVRGPDGSGEWYSSDGRVGLAHRRLSIVDLSERGAQPMASADGRLVISYNGEIYNYRELKRELQAQGRVFTTESDTEVLLHLYQVHGTAMLNKLRGMFAFALWDGLNRSLLLARDPFGIKPLYYADDGKALRVASQVKALLRSPIDTAPEPAGHAGFFLWGSVPAPWTLYRGIRSLMPGHFMRVGEHGAEQPQPYCRITDILAQAAAEPARGSEDEALEHISAALCDTVQAHLVSDVPVGVFLSAGLDSTMITALVARLGPAPRTLTLGFAEYAGTANDEVPLAESVSRQWGTRHSTVLIRRADFEADRANLLAAMDQPSIDGVNTWFVARAAASHGIKVALSGLGGDELFGSYPSFDDIPRIKRIAGAFAGVPGFGALLRRLSTPLLRPLGFPKHAGLLEYGSTTAGAYLLRRGLYMPWELPRVMDADMARAGWRDLQTFSRLESTVQEIPWKENNRLTISALEMSWYMRNQLLNDADWAGMAHSVEIRVPLLDVPLLTAVAPWFAAHPEISKRRIAEAAVPAVTAGVLDKPKTGFKVPVAQWLNDTSPLAGGRGMREWATRLVPPTVSRRPARILLLATDAYGGHGGIAYYNRCLAEALAAMPQVSEVVVVPRTRRFLPGVIPAKIRFLQSATGRKRHYVRTVAGLVRSHFDLVICGHIHLLPLAAPFAALRRIPLVLQVHGIDAWQPPNLPARLALSCIESVWSVSGVTRDRMNRWAGLPLSKYVIIPNMVHLERYGAGQRRAELVSRFHLEGRKVLVTLARLAEKERYKGIDEVLEAMPQLLEQEPTITYLVMGDGDDQARLEEKARALGVSERVIFTGLIDEEDKAEYLRLADVFVLPGRAEGFGIVYLEALACGIPVVGSQLDGSREALMDGELGELADPASLSSVRACILRALAKPKGVPPGLVNYDWPHYRDRVAAAAGPLI